MDVVQRADIGVRAALASWLPVAAIVPAVDAFALAATLAAAGAFGVLGSAFAVATWLALNWGTWRLPRMSPGIGADLGWITTRVALVTLVLLPFGSEARLRDTEILAMGALAALLLVPSRAAAYGALRALRRRGRGSEAALIVGAGPIAALVAETCEEHPELGLRAVGLLDASSAEASGESPLPRLGTPEDLPRVVRERGVRRVIVAFGAAREADLVAVLRAAAALPVAVYCVPRFFELRVPRERVRSDDLWGIPLVRLSAPGLRTFERIVKRALDVIVACLALLLAAPILAIAACAVRLTSPGPILFRQDRVGRGGRVFPLLKFRSMLVNDDSDTAWSVAHDDRVTRVGRFLRKTSVDELPQLLNILRGEMSLVGPRPERPHFVERFSSEVPRYRDRLRMPAGLTGWAQVHGLRGDTSIVERVRFDNAYIENWSLWLDLVILARTLREALMGGERRARRHEVRRVVEAPSVGSEDLVEDEVSVRALERHAGAGS